MSNQSQKMYAFPIPRQVGARVANIEQSNLKPEHLGFCNKYLNTHNENSTFQALVERKYVNFICLSCIDIAKKTTIFVAFNLKYNYSFQN
jgi:hypothetical protein